MKIPTLQRGQMAHAEREHAFNIEPVMNGAIWRDVTHP